MTHPPRVVARALALVLAAGLLARRHRCPRRRPGRRAADRRGTRSSRTSATVATTSATTPSASSGRRRPSRGSPPTSRSSRPPRSPRTTTGAPLSSFSLDFEGLTVDSVTVNGAAATYTRSTQTRTARQVQALHHAGDARERRVHDRGDLPRRADRAHRRRRVGGGLERHLGRRDVRQPADRLDDRLPEQQHACDKATYTSHARHPVDDQRRCLRGREQRQLVSNVAAGGRTTWVWSVAKPMASELSLISIGRYTMSTSDIVLADGRAP